VVGNTGGKGTIRIRTRVEGEYVVIRISDTGTGVPERVRAKIFDQFFTTKEIGRGTGLGLAIARAVVVDKHHGSIDFETEMGKGTTFVVRLPLGAQLDDGSPACPRAPDSAAKPASPASPAGVGA
jgi:two-component system NtrC family sensor kinase